MEVIVSDILLALAILKSNNDASNVYFQIARDTSQTIDVGNNILIIGSPTSRLLANSVSSGIISAIRECEDFDILQTDTKINPGNSGGALIVRAISNAALSVSKVA